MSAVPEALLKRIEDWLKDHSSGTIILNADDHRIKTYEFRVRGRVEPFDGGAFTIQKLD